MKIEIARGTNGEYGVTLESEGTVEDRLAMAWFFHKASSDYRPIYIEPLEGHEDSELKKFSLFPLGTLMSDNPNFNANKGIA